MKTCFLICPIGDEHSPERTRADDLLELVLQPALEVFQFEVVRADRIHRPTMITNDIIQLVQESQLCIADISDRNPNVFYEVGRRHETGKPLIQLIEAGQDIPFDLSGIRTLEYSLESPRTIKALIDKIRVFVKGFEDAGYAHPASGASLASIAGSIERMERQIAKMSLGPTISMVPSTPAEEGETLDLSNMVSNPLLATVMGPALQIDAMLKTGRVDEATAILAKSKNRLSTEKYRQLASMLTMAGVDAARVLTIEFLESAITSGDLSQQDMNFGIGALVHYYSSQDREKEGAEKLAPVFSRLLDLYSTDLESRAFVFNQMGKLYSVTTDLESAYLYAQKAVEADPGEAAYQRNLDLIRKRRAG